MKCEHGVEGCIHEGKEHDEESCFNGYWEHRYVCQECGYVKNEKVYKKVIKNGWYVPVEFKAKNCPKCKSEGSFV